VKLYVIILVLKDTNPKTTLVFILSSLCVKNGCFQIGLHYEKSETF